VGEPTRGVITSATAAGKSNACNKPAARSKGERLVNDNPLALASCAARRGRTVEGRRISPGGGANPASRSDRSPTVKHPPERPTQKPLVPAGVLLLPRRAGSAGFPQSPAHSGTRLSSLCFRRVRVGGSIPSPPGRVKSKCRAPARRSITELADLDLTAEHPVDRRGVRQHERQAEERDDGHDRQRLVRRGGV